MDLDCGRKIAFRALVGSHNYGLNDETSDKDYKYFVIPSVDDLYDGVYFSIPSQVSEKVDYDVHDIRKLPKLFFKSNINFLEILFSKEVKLGDVNCGKLYSSLYGQREKIAAMNIPYLFHSCIGMHYEKMKYLKKGTKTTKYLVQKFGYDTKQACHAFRLLDFLERYDFFDHNFCTAINYDYHYELNNDLARVKREHDLIMNIKHGKYTEAEFLSIIDAKLKKVLTLKDKYAKIPVDEKINSWIKNTIKNFVIASL